MKKKEDTPDVVKAWYFKTYMRSHLEAGGVNGALDFLAAHLGMLVYRVEQLEIRILGKKKRRGKS